MKDLIEKYQQACAKVAEAKQVRTNLLLNMQPLLRTVLNSVRGFVDMADRIDTITDVSFSRADQTISIVGIQIGRWGGGDEPVWVTLPLYLFHGDPTAPARYQAELAAAASKKEVSALAQEVQELESQLAAKKQKLASAEVEPAPAPVEHSEAHKLAASSMY